LVIMVCTVNINEFNIPATTDKLSKPRPMCVQGVEKMRLLGTVEVMTNKRVTIPNKLLDVLKAKEGDFLLFYEDDDGKIIVKMEKG